MTTKFLFGYTFVPMKDQDYEAFAGAPEGSLIARCDDGTVLIFSPSEGVVTEISADGSEQHWTTKAE
jgi:hypothetical protein